MRIEDVGMEKLNSGNQWLYAVEGKRCYIEEYIVSIEEGEFDETPHYNYDFRLVWVDEPPIIDSEIDVERELYEWIEEKRHAWSESKNTIYWTDDEIPF